MIAYVCFNHLVQKAFFRQTTRKLTIITILINLILRQRGPFVNYGHILFKVKSSYNFSMVSVAKKLGFSSQSYAYQFGRGTVKKIRWRVCSCLIVLTGVKDTAVLEASMSECPLSPYSLESLKTRLEVVYWELACLDLLGDFAYN